MRPNLRVPFSPTMFISLALSLLGRTCGSMPSLLLAGGPTCQQHNGSGVVPQIWCGAAPVWLCVCVRACARASYVCRERRSRVRVVAVQQRNDEGSTAARLGHSMAKRREAARWNGGKWWFPVELQVSARKRHRTATMAGKAKPLWQGKTLGARPEQQGQGGSQRAWSRWG